MKFIQFIGTQRSGSNLLRLMINQLDGVVAPHPPHILHTFTPLLKLYGNLQIQENFNQLVSDVCHMVALNPVPWEVAEMDPKEIARLCKHNNLIEVFRVIYEEKAKLLNAHTWCCKSMANVHYADQIEAAGLEPKYIHLYRDGRDVALSFQRAIVGHKHIFPLAEQWKNDQEASIALVEKVGRDRALSLSYEDLIHEPAATMRKICAFIDVTYDDKVLDYYHSKESDLTAKSGEMWENLTKPIMADNIGKYKKNLSEEEILIFESVAGNILQQLGYALEFDKSRHLHFTEETKADFLNKDKLLIEEFISHASAKDKDKRKPRQAHLAAIKERVSG